MFDSHGEPTMGGSRHRIVDVPGSVRVEPFDGLDAPAF
jgi:hypothetical protein